MTDKLVFLGPGLALRTSPGMTGIGVVMKRIAIIGGGPAGLMAAEVLANAGTNVTVFDRMPSVGRKFLFAGRGGLNLTYNEELNAFLDRYTPDEPRLRAAVESFPPAALRAWAEGLGEATFVGSSGRVFPQSFKATPLLRAWLRRLDERGVTFCLRHHWAGWDDAGALLFKTQNGEIRIVRADATVLALGGASWQRLGSDGSWVDPFAQAGITVHPLRPENCGFTVGWSEIFRARAEGAALKRIALRFGDRIVRGELIITKGGIEGGCVYALSSHLRDAIAAHGEAHVTIDLRPDVSVDTLEGSLAAPRGKQSLANYFRKTVKLAPVAIGLLQEAAAVARTRLTDATPRALAEAIKSVPVRLTAVASIARAISTAGGVAFDEIDTRFMLAKRPGVFVAGEMLDWEAPTGGYLLQASFATGVAAGQGALAWLKAEKT